MGKKVYLFATCLGSAALGGTVVSAIKLLQREGIEVIYKKDQTCCGQPGYSNGYFEDSKKIARYNLDLFEHDYPILVPSGSCAGVMTHDYLEMFQGDKDESRVEEFVGRVFELSMYLDEVLGIRYEDKGEPVKITWHTNCHALRVARSIESSKNLLRQLSNVELVDLKYEHECCGFGGTFSVNESKVSNAMAVEKINDIIGTGCKYVISGDGGCMLNISGTLKRHNSDVKFVHLYDFLLKRIEGEAI